MSYDLLIVGGGMVGRSIAAALAQSSLKIALIDAQKEERSDPRLIALNHGSIAFLKELGLWPSIEKEAAAIQEVHVSQRGQFGATRMKASDIDLEALGYVVPAQAINQALAAILQDQPRYEEWRAATVIAHRQEGEQAVLTVDQDGRQRTVSAPLVLGADGTYSTLRKLLNFETKIVDYQQSALVTVTTLTRSHQGRAYERFLDEGALAMLPLKESASGEAQCATIWTSSNTKIAELQPLNDADFSQQLQEQFGYRLGRLKNQAPRHVFPLHLYQVKEPRQGAVLLIGNAAHTIHPVAAQGLNLALYEIKALTQLMKTNLEQDQALLQDCPSNFIQGASNANLLLSHYLTPLFSSPFLGLKIARQLGMVGLDLCSPLKNRLSRLLSMEQSA